MKQKKIKLKKKGIRSPENENSGQDNAALKTFVGDSNTPNGSATVGVTASASFINGKDVDTFTD